MIYLILSYITAWCQYNIGLFCVFLSRYILLVTCLCHPVGMAKIKDRMQGNVFGKGLVIYNRKI